jgi:hypothetical protein
MFLTLGTVVQKQAIYKPLPTISMIGWMIEMESSTESDRQNHIFVVGFSGVCGAHTASQFSMNHNGHTTFESMDSHRYGRVDAGKRDRPAGQLLVEHEAQPPSDCISC